MRLTAWQLSQVALALELAWERCETPDDARMEPWELCVGPGVPDARPVVCPESGPLDHPTAGEVAQVIARVTGWDLGETRAWVREVIA